MRPLEHYKDASWFRLMRLETRERCVAPTGKTHDFASWRLRCGRFGRFQHVEAAAIQEKRVIPVNAAQLLLRRMIIWKYLSFKLAQSLLCLGRIQLHDLLLFVRAVGVTACGVTACR